MGGNDDVIPTKITVGALLIFRALETWDVGGTKKLDRI